MTESKECFADEKRKCVSVRRFANGYGWNWDGKKKNRVVDVIHGCILAKKLGAGVTNPILVMQTRFQDVLSEPEIINYAGVLTQFDNADANVNDIEKLKRLAKKLDMYVRCYK